MKPSGHWIALRLMREQPFFGMKTHSSQPKPKTILIVEDERDAYTLLAYHFENAGFLTLWADNGAYGLELLRAANPDAIILDVILPRLSGYELCRAIKADPDTRQIPVMLLTARREVADKIFGFECGADTYITKPYHPREVVVRLEELMAQMTPRPAIEPVTA